MAKKGETKIEIDRVANVVRRYEYINPNVLANILNVRYPTARIYLSELEKQGVVEKLSINTDKNKRYIYEVLQDQTTLTNANDDNNNDNQNEKSKQTAVD